MNSNLRARLTYANVVSTVCLFLVLGGTAYAAATIGSAEVIDESLQSVDLKDGQVSAADLNRTIPSGATVVGAFGGTEDDGHGTGASPTSTYRQVIDLHGLRAPVAIKATDVSFDDATISANVAKPGEANTGCTGSASSPSAPPGKVCLYVILSGVDVDSGSGDSLAGTVGATHGFSIGAVDTRNRGASLRGVWAYRAP